MIFFLCISFLLSFSAKAQSTIGTEFIVGFMENNKKPGQPDEAIVVITALEDVTGTLTFQGQVFPFSISEGQFFKKEFNSNDLDVIHRSSEEVENKSILIQASGNISVNAFNQRKNSSDGTLVLPISSLGEDYFVTAHFSNLAASPDNSESTVLIVANEDNTQVEITPSGATVKGKAKNSPFQITLNAGQSYQIKAFSDLTGTRVRILNNQEGSCKRLAVFGGNKMTTAGDCGESGDHLFQQTLPISYWSDFYIHVPLLNRTSGETLKVLASQNNTEVFLDGVNKGTLNAGEFLNLELEKNTTGVIRTSKPAAVTLLARSQDCNSSPGLIGDPFLLRYQGINQRIKNHTFYSYDEDGFIFNNANILAPTSSISSVRLNNTLIANRFKPVPGFEEFSFAQVDLKDGANTITSSDGVILYIYGAGQRASYGYSAGFDLLAEEIKMLKNEVEIGDDIQVCVGQEEEWKIDDPSGFFDSYSWDFGDGSPALSGQVVTYAYQKEGKFLIRVKASKGQGSCAIVKNFEMEVEVYPKASGLISGQEEGCAGIELTYTFESEIENTSVEWKEVVGGSILIKDDQTIQIIWSADSEEHYLLAVPKSDKGCEGEEIRLDFKVQETQELDKPSGPSNVCSSDTDSVLYKAVSLLGQTDIEWLIIGGEILSGQGSDQVKVAWDAGAESHLISYSKKKEGNQSCDVASSVLEIVISEPSIQELSAPSGPNALCEASLEAVLYKASDLLGQEGINWIVEGGVIRDGQGTDQVEILWNADAEIRTVFFTKVEEKEEGCDLVFESAPLSVSISSSDLLPAPIGQQAICSEVSELMIYTIEGSLGNQQIEWLVVGGKIQNGQGSKQVEVVWDLNSESRSIAYSLASGEENGCGRVSEKLEIKVLEVISLSWEEFKGPSCQGDSDGMVRLSISGGTGDYIISWSHDAQLDAIEATDLASGDYNVKVKDASGCGEASLKFSLEQPTKLGLARELEILPVVCNSESDGGFNAYVQGGTPPYRVEGLESVWDGEKLSVRNLGPGAFSLFILDINDCSLSVSGNIQEFEPLTLAFSETVIRCPGGSEGALGVEVQGGKAPYTYTWSEVSAPGVLTFNTRSALSEGATLENIPFGEYSVTVTDALGCTVQGFAILSESKPQVRMPTGFMPKDGKFGPVSTCPVDFTLLIYNKWGNIVYSGNEGWDGLSSGKEVPVGTYSYKLSYQYIYQDQPKQEEISGVVTLIR